MVEYAYHNSMQERGTIMKQDRRSTKLSDDAEEKAHLDHRGCGGSDNRGGNHSEKKRLGKIRQVLSGLSEGDTVYYRYADTLEYSFVK